MHDSLPRPASRPLLLPAVVSTVSGLALVTVGLLLAYAALMTPLLSSVLPVGRPDPAHLVVGMVAWAIALVAPAGLLLAGTSRLARTLARVRGRAGRRSIVARSLAGLAPEVTVWSGLVLDDGRPIGELVLGSFGAAIIRELPSSAVTRIRDGRWEARTSQRWISLENPLERAARDAERVRHWLGDGDADFVVKVYAAVVGPQPTVERTARCAVLDPSQLEGWIRALPAQRSLTEPRREQMVDRVRALARG